MIRYCGRPGWGASSRLVLVALTILWASLRLDAHEVVVEQVVKVSVAPESDRLFVSVDVPVTLLSDAGLPRLANGFVDPTVDAAALQVVAADVVRNLDLRLNDAPVSVLKATARLASNNQSVDVEITYGLTGPPVRLSARLNAFQGGPLQPPRTDVAYQPLSGTARFLSVTGPPIRVAFDPALGDVFRRFSTLAFDVTFAGGGHALFLICLLLPMRPARESARLVATFLAVQAVGVLVSTTMAATSAGVAPVDMIAWSIIVAAAVCAIAGAPVRVFAGLSGMFGLLNGIEVASSFNTASQLSGSHATAALLTFITVSLTAEVWLAAVLLATRHWLDRVLRHQMAGIIVAAALVAHVAVHHVLDRASELTRAESFTARNAVTLLILGWTFVMLIAASVRLIRGTATITDRAESGGAAL